MSDSPAMECTVDLLKTAHFLNTRTTNVCVVGVIFDPVPLVRGV